MILDIDFSQSSSGFTPIEDGVYRAKISSIERKMSKTNSPYLNTEFTITEGKFKNRKVFTNFSLKSLALWKLQSLLMVIGMKADAKMQLDTDMLIGRELRISIRQRSYTRADGTQASTNDVAEFLPIENDMDLLDSPPKKKEVKDAGAKEVKSEINVNDLL